ncbi:MAG: nitroreductase [Dissulfurispiraceae bacterium]
MKIDLLTGLKTRKVVRAFSDKPVADDLLRALLETAINAPSGSNIQPWEVYVATGAKTKELRRLIDETVKNGNRTFGVSYSGTVPERYTRRSAELFSQLKPYLLKMGVKADYIMKGSLHFFNAPAVAFVYIHESLTPARLPCIGAFMVYLMLTAQAYGVGSCPIGYVRGLDDVIRGLLGVPEDLNFVISMALGYPEEDMPINRFKSRRVSLDENCRILS